MNLPRWPVRGAMVALGVLLWSCGDTRPEGTTISIRIPSLVPAIPSSLPPGQEPANLPERFTNSLGMRMILVHGGTFQMGTDRGGDELRPAHAVTLTSYYLGQHEVTKGLFRRFVAETGVAASLEELDPTAINLYRGDGKPWRYTYAPGDDYPIFGCTWPFATAFCAWLSRVVVARGRSALSPTDRGRVGICGARGNDDNVLVGE